MQLENWLKQIDVKADKVYDIGGNQLPIRKRVKSWDVKEYEILDLPDWDLNKEWRGDRFWKYCAESADVMFCIEVIEYVYDPVQAFRNMANLLKPGGLLYFSFHFIYPLHKPVGTDYLRYTADGIIKILKETGFEPVEVKGRTVVEGDLNEFFVRERMHTRKDVDNNIIGYSVKAKRL